MSRGCKAKMTTPRSLTFTALIGVLLLAGVITVANQMPAISAGTFKPIVAALGSGR